MQSSIAGQRVQSPSSQKHCVHEWSWLFRHWSWEPRYPPFPKTYCCPCWRHVWQMKCQRKMLSLFYFQIINNPCFLEKIVQTELLPLEPATDLIFKNLTWRCKKFPASLCLEPGGENCQGMINGCLLSQIRAPKCEAAAAIKDASSHCGKSLTKPQEGKL